VVFRIRIEGILIEHQLAAGDGSGAFAFAVKRETRSRFGVPRYRTRSSSDCGEIGSKTMSMMPCWTPAEPMFGDLEEGSRIDGRAPGWSIQILPPSSTMYIRPSGKNSMLVGRFRPVRRISFWK